MKAIFDIMLAFVGFFVSIGLVWLMDLIPWGKSRSENVQSTDRRTVPVILWFKLIVILTVTLYIASSVMDRRVITGYRALQIVLGPILGVPVFGPLGVLLFDKLRIKMPVKGAMLITGIWMFWGPSLAVGVMEALGLPVGPVFPFLNK